MKMLSIIALSSILFLGACSDSKNGSSTPNANNELVRFYSKNGQRINKTVLSSTKWCSLFDEDEQVEETVVAHFKVDDTYVVNYIAVDNSQPVEIEKGQYKVEDGKIVTTSNGETNTTTAWTTTKMMDDGSLTLLVSGPGAVAEFISCPNEFIRE